MISFVKGSFLRFIMIRHVCMNISPEGLTHFLQTRKMPKCDIFNVLWRAVQALEVNFDLKKTM